MKTLLLILTLLLVPQNKEVRLYRNQGGLLLYNPARVAAQFNGNTLYLTVDSFDWQFSRNCAVYFNADDEEYSLPCEVVSYYAFTVRYKTYVSETLRIQSSELDQILKAEQLVMRVGSYEFKVKPKDLKKLRGVK